MGCKVFFLIYYHYAVIHNTRPFYFFFRLYSCSEICATSLSTISSGVPSKEFMDEALAKTLYLGIIQDCGVFGYSNTVPSKVQPAALT